MTKNQEYAQKYAEYAQEQMRLYGIPASVTLAQGILESANGQSRLAKNENNHFGIKASKSWLDKGGQYALYTDDRPDEKFCKYDSVRDSYEHHSKFLVENKRYAECFKLQADDFRGWCDALAKAGYASSEGYGEKLKSIILRNGLDKYDNTAGYAKTLSNDKHEEALIEDKPSESVRQSPAMFNQTPSEAMEESPEDWMKRLLVSEDSGLGMKGGGGSLIDLIVAAFSSLLLLATQIDSRNKEEQKEAITRSVQEKSIDLTSLTRGMSDCQLRIKEDGGLVLKAENGKGTSINHTLTNAELTRLSQVLNDNSLSPEAKQMRLKGFISTVVLSEQASQNFERGMSEQQSRETGLRR